MAQLTTVLQCCIVLTAAGAPLGAAGQSVQDLSHPTTRAAVAGARYRAGWFHRLLFGSHYRDLWATTVQVEVLDLSRFAGGLTPTGSSDFHGPTHKTFSRFGAYQTYGLGEAEVPAKPA